MPHLTDGDHCSILPCSDGVPLVCVGWLSSETQFSTGSVTEAFFSALCDHLRAAWRPPFACAGRHQCDLCQFGSSTTRFGDFEFSSVSGSELFIPAGDSIFVAPVSIAHYIAAHRYLPPVGFISAVQACPPQRSRPYLELLLRSGGRAWLSALDTPPTTA